jgi:hypothetical protein
MDALIPKCITKHQRPLNQNGKTQFIGRKALAKPIRAISEFVFPQLNGQLFILTLLVNYSKISLKKFCMACQERRSATG